MNFTLNQDLNYRVFSLPLKIEWMGTRLGTLAGAIERWRLPILALNVVRMQVRKIYR